MSEHAEFPIVSNDASRPLGRAMRRGWRMRCPSCGGGPLFSGYLKVRRTCASCGEELHHHRADDMPAYATILIVGKVIVFALVLVERAWSPPMWIHWAAWPTLALLLTLLLLPRIKGSIVGMQWAMRMHGFGRRS